MIFLFGRRQEADEVASSCRVLRLKAFACHDAECGDAGKEDGERQRLSVCDSANAEQEVTDDKIEQRPENVHRGRGESFSGRFGEWRRKTIARDAMHEVGHGIRKKCAGEEACQIVIPDHCGVPSC